MFLWKAYFNVAKSPKSNHFGVAAAAFVTLYQIRHGASSNFTLNVASTHLRADCQGQWICWLMGETYLLVAGTTVAAMLTSALMWTSVVSSGGGIHIYYNLVLPMKHKISKHNADPGNGIPPPNPQFSHHKINFHMTFGMSSSFSVQQVPPQLLPKCASCILGFVQLWTRITKSTL
jgi:hypothetical protein